MARATNFSLISGGRLGMAPVQMDAPQAIPHCQLEVFVQHDAAQVPGRQGLQQMFYLRGLCIRLAEMQDFQPRIQQGGDGFGLSIEEVRPCDDYQFHIRSEREYMGLQGTQIYCPKSSIEGLAEACNELDSFACLYASHHGRGYAQYAQVGREVCPTLFGRI